MNFGTKIQLVLALLKLANWIAGQVSQAQWKASGYAKAMAEQQAAIASNVGIAASIYRETADKSTEQLNRELQE